MWQKIKEKISVIFSYYPVKIIAIALVVNILCDILNQRSLLVAVKRIFTEPIIFFYNLLIVLTTVGLTGLFKKKKFFLCIMCIPWLGIAIANFVVQIFRNTPLSFIDFIILPVTFSVFNSYLALWHYIVILIAVIGVVTALVLLFKRERPRFRKVLQSVIVSGVSLALALLLRVPLTKANIISSDYSNLTNAYRDYGLPYCFAVSIFDRGVDEPKEYSEELVDEYTNQINKLMKDYNYKLPSDYSVNGDKKPNVIFLQLESFYDANHFINLEYTKDPNPNFTKLKEKYPSGYLGVPTFGAGTANVEFEVMTGLDLTYFGAGEYPYKTVLTDNTSESIAYTLGDLGYYTTVMHNNRGNFYGRDDVFPMLGYDRFVSSEFMINLEKNPVGWYKDKCLEYEIMKALNSSEEQDFIYTIAVQSHGKYLDELDSLEEIHLEASCINDELDQGEVNQYTYFANQIYEVDMFLGDLVKQLDSYQEPVMLVVFGDHLPNFMIDESDVANNDLYKTEYVIYTNYENNMEDKDLTTYTLSSYILQNIGCTNGIINQLHITSKDNPSYREALHELTYDMFEGEKYAWDCNFPHEKKEMVFGYDDVLVTSVSQEEKKVIIKGENFNKNSVVYVNDTKYSTKYIDANTLSITYTLKDGAEFNVKQIRDREVLSESDNFIYLEK